MNRFENLDLAESFLLRKRQLQKEVKDVAINRIIKIAVLADSTINELLDYISTYLKFKGIGCNYWIGDFNKIYEDAVFRIEELIDFKPDIILIHDTGRSDISDNLGEWFEMYEYIWNSLKKCNCRIIQTNLPLPKFRALQNFENFYPDGDINRIMKKNIWLAEKCYSLPYVYLFDLNYISSKIGIDNWYDERLWYMYGCSYSQRVVPIVGYYLSKLIFSMIGLNHKLLILDLDNTLWGGVWADDGMDGVRLGGETAEGRAYNQFQKYIHTLKNSGMLLAVCSKNTIEVIKNCFDHAGAELTWDDFACVKVNWKCKTENIKEIIAEMNIGLESVIFLDDNPVERLQVATELPMIWIPKLDRVENYIEILEKGLIFDKKRVTVEDVNRTRYYIDNKNREKVNHSSVDRETYLRQLKMKLFMVSPVNNIERIVQLINKTNQFQVTGKRGTESGLLQYAKANLIVAAKLIDVFGDNGLISVVGISFRDRIAVIDYWVMSCRVFQRNVEYALFCYIIKTYIHDHADIVRVTHMVTEKNEKLKDMFSKLGFIEKSHIQDNVLYEMSVKDFSDLQLDYIEVYDE